MSRADVIRFGGVPVALVIDGEARINDGLSREVDATVKGMCLFAMEVQVGAIDGPYSDARALQYARLASAHRARAADAR
jgi:cobyrinic acid a,c-diamide synthase